MEKYHVYKCYRRGVYLGVIENVKSELSFSQEINSAASSLTIKVAVDIDVATKAVSALLDETGDTLLDENSNPLLEERQPDVIGNSDDTIKLRNGNLVEVYEYSSYHPNGIKLFSGMIESIEAPIGGSQSSALVTLLLISRGSELANRIIQDGN